MSIKPKKETQMDLLKKYLQEEKFGSLKVTVQRKEGRKKERKKEIAATVENSMAASQKNLKIEPPHMRACSVMSDSLQFQRLQLTRFLYPWDFPGKNTGVGCHFLFQYDLLIPFLDIYLKKKTHKNTNLKVYIHPSFHSCIIYNCQGKKAT